MDFIRLVAPPDYRLRHDLLATIRNNGLEGRPTTPLSGLTKALNCSEKEAKAQLSLLIVRKHVRGVGQPHEWLMGLLSDGAEACINRTHLKEGRDEVLKTASAYGALLALGSTVIATLVAIAGYRSSNRLEERIERMEHRVGITHQELSPPTPRMTDLVTTPDTVLVPAIRESVWALCGPCDTLPATKKKARPVFATQVHQYRIDSAGNPVDTTFWLK